MNGLNVLWDVATLGLEPVLVGNVGEGDELAFGRGVAVLAGDAVGLLIAQLLHGAGLLSAAAVISLEPSSRMWLIKMSNQSN